MQLRRREVEDHRNENCLVCFRLQRRQKLAPGLILAATAAVLAVLACARSDVPLFSQAPAEEPVAAEPTAAGEQGGARFDPLETYLPPTLAPGTERPDPTPDPPRGDPALRTDTAYHLVLPGDSLGWIAQQYNVTLEQLMEANGIWNADSLEVGYLLIIPAVRPLDPGPAVKLLPDSEVVYGPSSALFDLPAYIEAVPGALRDYHEEIGGVLYDAAGILQLVAERYSIHPRLLLALLEFQSGLLTQETVPFETRAYPLGYVRSGWETLFVQLSWAADQLNTGYYLWRAGWNGPYLFEGGYVVVPGDGINAGTAALQYFFSQLKNAEGWRTAVGTDGFAAVYEQLFGDPFQWAVEPLLPVGLVQPELQLPFVSGEWSFTSGPHSAWGSGAAWAALDFAPPGNAWGCVRSDEWVTAVSDGLVLRTGNGQVLLDLDGDGFEQTGWVILYMHIESRERVQPGDILRAGDPIGHPSCEGGFSTGTHVHLARKYNGEWISADGNLPFILDGWVSAGDGIEYNGTLTRDGVVLEAYAGQSTINAISR
ncbi:MAG: LysM peptidoglycan-binding domain-containing protein [Anaerolineales bacterium]|nr:LysM peptidoglycan-binding domain-containing protein [Anaerolineales bacterium]